MRSTLWGQILVTLMALLVLLSSVQAASLRGYLTNLLLDDDTPDIDTNLRNSLKFIKHMERIQKKNTAPPAMCGQGRQPYECNDGLMGVWLRIMKNPDYSD